MCICLKALNRWWLSCPGLSRTCACQKLEAENLAHEGQFATYMMLLMVAWFNIYPSDSAKCMVGLLASLRFDGVTPSEKRIVLVDINGKYRFLKKKEMSWNLVYRNYSKPACWVCLLGRVLLSSGDKCNDNYFDFVSCSLSLCQPGVFGCGFISLVLLWPLPTATFVRQ